MSDPAETQNDPEAVRETYDRSAPQYAERFVDELAGKPMDRAWLDVFAADVITRPGVVLDVGCGPGQTTWYLHDRGVRAVGVDRAPAMIAQARALHPDGEFRVGDMFALSDGDGTVAGLVAFYAIVHLTRAELARAFAEWRRVLAPGGAVMLSFHVGHETLVIQEFLGVPTQLGWNLFTLGEVADALAAAGLTVDARMERRAYPQEHATVRGYVLARRPG